MIQVEEAQAIIQAEVRDFGMESVPFEKALGRVLAENLKTDRDMPPYNRVAMDGIAVRYAALEKGIRSFRISATQAAGDQPSEILSEEDCIEIMTGAALPASADTVIRYEDIDLQDGKAIIKTDGVSKGQNVHLQGKDKRQDDAVALAGQVITPALIGVAAAVGARELQVKKLPKVVVVSTGDELVKVEDIPLPYQIRRSNSYTLKAALEKYGMQADLLHIPDEVATIKRQLQNCLQLYDVLLLSGGISMGKFDFVPQVLEELEVAKLFRKVKQRPGKPFWFGKHKGGTLAFALPGNPVSTFLCFHRYFLPWLEASLGVGTKPAMHAVLNQDVSFNPALQYFLQVKLSMNKQGQVQATPLTGNGSGDFANLVEADAFLELPSEQSNFKQGEVYRVWPFKQSLM